MDTSALELTMMMMMMMTGMMLTIYKSTVVGPYHIYRPAFNDTTKTDENVLQFDKNVVNIY